MIKLILILFLTFSSLNQAISPQIFYVSMSPTSIVNPVYSSLRGGAMIYINAIGQNPIAHQNQVFVGNFPCIIPSDGVSDTFIACATTDSGSNLDIKNLAVTLIAYQQVFTTSYPDVVNYINSYTPYISEIFPAAGYANVNINLFGVHRIQNLGDGRDMGGVVAIKLGKDLCSRFDVVQDNITQYALQMITCVESSMQQAGKYNVSEQLTPGYAEKNPSMRRSSLVSGEYFEFTALPAISSIFTPKGNLGGQYMVVLGTGFSVNPNNISVTVDNNKCIVSSSSDQTISCTLSPRNNSLSSKLITNSTNQTNSYFSGAGLSYVRYSVSGSMNATTFAAAIRSNNTAILGTLQQMSVKAQLRTGDLYGSNYGEAWTGYFTPPVSGSYNFRGLGDDQFAFYISGTYGSTEPATTALIYSNVPQPYNDFYLTYVPSAEQSVTLQAGLSYYIEAYHINYAAPGFFNLEVDVPNSDTTLPFQVYEVATIVTNATVQPEVVIYSMVGGSNGSINLKIVRTNPSTKAITYNVNKTIAYGCSAQSFQSSLNSFDSFSFYQISVEQNIYDSNNNTLNTTTSASRIDYVVSFYLLRPTAFQNQKFIVSYIGYTGLFQTTPTTSHSPLITGTWGLSIGNLPITLANSNSPLLPYNIAENTLEAAIQKIVGYQKVVVQQYLPNHYGFGYSSVWLIKFIGINSKIPIIEVNTVGLSGGATLPTVSVVTIRNYSSSITFSSVDYRLINTYTNIPNVMVTVNGIPSLCLGNCSYTFMDVSQITSLSLSSSILSLGLSNPTSLNITSSDITVTADGLPCIASTGPLSSLTCSLKTNIDGSPILRAGALTPTVYISPYGIIALANGINPITIPLIAKSLSVSTGGNNGGFRTTLTGSGFPLDQTQASITVCGNLATITSITNQQIILYIPSCNSIGQQTINLRVGQVLNTNLSFTYTDGSTNAPKISLINPSSSNPAKKGVLNITGSGFGSNSSQVTVFLANSSGKIYQLKVLQISDTFMQVGLSGGLPGNFIVQIGLGNTAGDSISTVPGADAFSYSFTITSITPNTGSYNGGTLLTITGSNFSPATGDTLVYVGSTLNWFCAIESINSTVIQCRTPPISKDYQPGDKQAIVISTNLIMLSQCSTDCNFTYLTNSESPNLLTISSSQANDQNVTLTGTNFTNNGSFNTCKVSLTNTDSSAVTVLPTIACTQTSASFTILQTITSGNYQVRIRNDIGESNSLSLVINWVIGNPSYNTSGGSVAGSIVTFTGGSGYPSSIGGLFSISITSPNISYPVTILSCCQGNNLTLYIPPTLDTINTSMKISFTGPASPTTPQIKTYLSSPSQTPTIVIQSSIVVSAGSNTIIVNRTSSISGTITSVSIVSTLDSTIVVNVANWTINGTIIAFNTTLTAGSYNIMILSSQGYYQCKDILNVMAPAITAGSSVPASFYGGSYTISAANLSPASYIVVNNLIGKIINYSSSAVTYQIPSLITVNSNAALNLASASLIDLSRFTLFSDQNASTSNVSAAFDGMIDTIYGSPNTQCWIGIDIGSGLQAYIDRIRFFPYLQWKNTANKILYATFQGSNDQNTWTTLGTIDQTVHSGYNTIKSLSSSPFRYIRFKHNSSSQCNMAEIELYGIVYSNLNANMASQLSDVWYQDGYNNRTLSSAIEYRLTNTPIVSSVNPPYGDIFGGYSLTITGQNLGFALPNILIDNIPCVNVNISATTIVCTVGARPNLPTINTFTVFIGTQQSIIQSSFLYVLRWSDSRTWGVGMPPVDGDLVYVPQGMTLLVDQNTPVLAGIAAQNGTLIFSNDADLVVQAGFITVVGGRFVAGTEAHPYYRKLTFILYGNYYGTQQPMFGNKGIGCLECKFSMYGIPRQPTWTTIAATISPGDTIFIVSQNVDWQVGEQIVIASTSFFHNQAEQMTIIAINNRTITVNAPFLYKHVSVIQNYGTSDQLVMQAEVGLLTRNIKVMGDSTSAVGKYGAHLMLAGQAINGFEGHVAYTQFYHCGQPQILGRYCIHFHMNGEIPTSYARGNAVHESFARVVTIHAVYFLTVELNVGYRVHGHNFFVEDGIQTKNVIRYNLAISSLTVTNMLQTDISVASFWVTNPSNDFYGNRAAGGDFYGVWYEIKSNPDGPSATNDVCPIGNPLGKVYNNTAHSNIRFGLRIFRLYSRQYPCQSIRDDSNANDPWAYNPSITSTFSNFTVYKNLEDGVLAEQTGDVVFDKFVIAQNYNAGIQFYVANFTKQPVLVINSVIIGTSNTNTASDPANYSRGMCAVITPRTGQTNFSNIRFYNYPSGSIQFKVCSQCNDQKAFTNIGTDIFTSKLSFNNVNGNYLVMLGPKRDIIYDEDASLAIPFDGNYRNRTSATIVNNYIHIALYQQNNCVSAPNGTKWNNALMCDQTAIVRRVMFTNLQNPNVFKRQIMKVLYLTNASVQMSPTMSSSLFTQISSYLPTSGPQPKIQKPLTWSLPFITGNVYSIWWGSGLDFTNMAISSTSLFKPNDGGIVFKFNYTINRELYRVGPIRGGKKFTNINYIPMYFAPGNISSPSYYPYLDPAVCQNGDWYHNNANSSLRMFTVCQSGKNKNLFEYTQVDAVICQLNCPAPAGTTTKETFSRRWSNATQWPNGTVPKANQNVTVPGEWILVLDMDPLPAAYMIIDGTLIADDTRDVNITANAIFIRAGNITAGSPSNPFQHQFTIQINANKQDYGYYIDPIIAGNKYFVVTGSLNLYGTTPNTISTYLTQSAMSGSSTIYVASSAGWVAGDSIALAPSFSNPYEYETVTISSINSDGTLSVTPALKYTHYGSNSITISNSYGSLDARCRVGHLTRNIQIVSGPDYGWGFNMIVYGYMDGTIVRVGSVNLIGVQLLNGGQYDTENSPLVFLNTIGGNQTSTITNTSIVNCKALCVNINYANNITMTNNILYKGLVFGVRAMNMQSFIFKNNLLIGIIGRPNMTPNSELIACFATFKYINPIKDKVFISDNICQGSDGHGFALPHILCSELNTHTMGNNTAGSCMVGFIFNSVGADCQASSWISAYACTIGQMSSAYTKTLMFSNFILADNQRGGTLKFGYAEGGTNHTGWMYNSYITAVSRPTCAQCYGASATDCSGNIGLRMLTATPNSEQLPGKFGLFYDIICKGELFDSKCYLYNVIFDSFSQNYSQPALSTCGSNFALRPHSLAFDLVGGHYLFNCSCTNCDTNSYVKCDPNSPSHLGWFGGCGDILCTGLQNYLVRDYNGTFLPFRGVIIPNNPVIGNAEYNCTYNTIMNGHLCQRQDFATLQYQSIAADRHTRIMWPVNLTYDGSSYTTTTNGFRQWEWMGKQPLNLRLARFNSIVKLQSIYNISFASKPPIDMQFQIERRTPLGNNLNYVIIKMHYPLPNMIRTQVNGVTIQPILQTDGGSSRTMNTSLCGDNTYFYTNYTIHFVVTEDLKCLVRISLTDSIQLTTHFAMNTSQFFSNNVKSSFISNLCALLRITDMSRVAIVGVYTGSVMIIATIGPTSSDPVAAGGDPSMTTTSNQLTSLINNGSLSNSLTTTTGFQVLGLTSTFYVLPSGSTSNSSSMSSNSGIIIGIVVGGIVFFVVFVLSFFYCLRKRAKILEEIKSSDEQFHYQKDIQKHEDGRFEVNSDVQNDSQISNFKINRRQATPKVQSSEIHQV